MVRFFFIARCCRHGSSIKYCFSFKQMGKVCVVGNGPLSDAQRKDIRSECTRVYRFNDLKNFREGDPIDVHVCREWEGSRNYAGMNMSRADKLLLVGKHAAQDATPGADYVATNGLRALPVFDACGRNNLANRNPSTGTIILSKLQQDPAVSKIDVYGMNWAFSKEQGHARDEATLVKKCCTKCTVHASPTAKYV
jgi:hypothetical protein